MKKLILGIFCVFIVVQHVNAQSAIVNIDAGYLTGALGTSNEPIGGLLQLIASPSGTFSAPTSSSYISGDNVVVASFAMNYSGGTTPETTNTISFTLSSFNLQTGEKLLLRFYPSLTYASMSTAPTLGTTYGQVRSDTAEFGPPTDSTETAWIVPAAGNNVDLDYLTASDSPGIYSNASAQANFIVAAVPEPSTYALLGGGLLGLVGLRMRRRGAAKHT